MLTVSIILFVIFWIINENIIGYFTSFHLIQWAIQWFCSSASFSQGPKNLGKLRKGLSSYHILYTTDAFIDSTASFKFDWADPIEQLKLRNWHNFIGNNRAGGISSILSRSSRSHVLDLPDSVGGKRGLRPWKVQGSGGVQRSWRIIYESYTNGWQMGEECQIL